MVIVLVALATALFVATPALASTTLNSYEKQLLSLVNKERAKRHLHTLKVNPKLGRSARVHSTDMSAHKYFAHDSQSGEKWSARIIRYGYTQQGCSYWRAGEDIYYGAGLLASPVAVVKAWMASKAHRQVILTKTFRDIGVGAVKTDDGYGKCDGTVWFFTLDLGRRIVR
jgi:uncharacterized protein YkwD